MLMFVLRVLSAFNFIVEQILLTHMLVFNFISKMCIFRQWIRVSVLTQAQLKRAGWGHFKNMQSPLKNHADLAETWIQPLPSYPRCITLLTLWKVVTLFLFSKLCKNKRITIVSSKKTTKNLFFFIIFL